MENLLLSPLGMASRSSAPMEGIRSQENQNSLVQFEPFDLNNQNQTLDGYNSLSRLQGASPVNDSRVGNPNLGALVTDCGLPFSGAQQNVANFSVSEHSAYPLMALSSYVSNQFTNGLSSSFTSSVNYGSNEAFHGHFHGPVIAGLYGSSSLSNELSLSLATIQPSAVNVSNVSDQCSEISSGSKELSLSCSSYHNSRVSSVLSGSRYLQVVQEILTEIATYSLEVLEQASVSKSMPMSSTFAVDENAFKVQMDPAMQKQAVEAKKAQLMTLLQLVDDRYGQCLDEIHTVISAFHAATELDPQLHTCFVLQTLSFLYKSFRERISNQILALTDQGERALEKEPDHFQKQWTLQQLKKKDHHMWKPQRGLPERSVSVLRAWMFQNFLHPYPKDAEKHLLAVKSGLTRSQVSNWFINARVRLWKPMIEEMYAEMNKRKGEGSSNNHRNEFSFGNLRFNINGM